MFFERPDEGQRAVLVRLEHAREPAGPRSLDELAELARARLIDPVARVVSRRKTPHPRFYFGSGKVDEIRDAIAAHRADLVVVDHDLSPGQGRNLERTLNVRVLTRTELILEIFAARARTYEGQLQVELAQLEHAQTRLVGGWTHLDRQRGGGANLRGAGETQLEMDQRLLADRIKRVSAKLEHVARRRAQGRRRRKRSDTPTVALVGYTNAGKSTLFNALTDGQVEVKDQLFATLDPTLRRVELAGNRHAILADTVGFVSRLPHALVRAFHATLEEVENADLLIHVIDGSDPDALAHVDDVLGVLREIDAGDLPMLSVVNKCDRVEALPPELDGPEVVHVSALDGTGLDRLRARIGELLGTWQTELMVEVPAHLGRTRSWIYDHCDVLSEESAPSGATCLRVRADTAQLGRLETFDGIVLRPLRGVPRITLPPI